MKDANDNITPLEQQRRLADAIRSVKNANADRDDVVIEMREAERMRLELLAQELAPVIAEVPQDTDLFDFAVSTGLQPRFWIDAVTHVSMGRDKRTFRFLKDTRNGRVVLAETSDIRAVANQVTRYLAERIVERQRLMEGDVVDFRDRRSINAVRDGGGDGIGSADNAKVAASKGIPAGRLDMQESLSGAERTAGSELAHATQAVPDWRNVFTGVVIVVAGILAGLGAAAALYWDRLQLDRWTGTN